jgi:hypothetical protein
MYSTSLAMSEARSWDGVSAAACTSLSSGSEILPSGRTGTVTVVLFQTAMSRTSSMPIRIRR